MFRTSFKENYVKLSLMKETPQHHCPWYTHLTNQVKHIPSSNNEVVQYGYGQVVQQPITK